MKPLVQILLRIGDIFEAVSEAFYKAAWNLGHPNAPEAQGGK